MPSPLAPPSGDPATLARQAIDHHPTIVAARARLEQVRHTLELEKARRLPDPTLTAGYKRSARHDTLVAGLVVPLPLFARNEGNIECAAAEERVAALELDALYKRQLAATTGLMHSAQALAANAQQLHQRMLHLAEVVRTASRSSFREGATEISFALLSEKAFTAQLLLQEGTQP
ncbi:MAG: TolC family protein [Deltaproteobacteria bacterium]|nr:TolC family protein [Deltaproteobacteria bacterium]